MTHNIAPTIEGFFAYIYERQSIWHKRFILKEAWPWTRDPILQRYHFLNVFRIQDKTTQYLIRRVLDTDLTNEAKILNVIFYRLFNRAGIYRNGLHPLDPTNFDVTEVIKNLDNHLADGGKLFNNAYFVTGKNIIDSSHRPEDKHVQILLSLRDQTSELKTVVKSLRSAETPEEALKLISKRRYVGPFLAVQIFLDLTYCDFFPQKWTGDDVLFVRFRSKSGIKLARGLKESDEYPWEKYPGTCKWLRDQQIEQFLTLNERTGQNWNDVAAMEVGSSRPRYLCLMDIQCCLTEFWKYWQAKREIGESREYYQYQNLRQSVDLVPSTRFP
jgi:hypothetical protein